MILVRKDGELYLHPMYDFCSMVSSKGYEFVKFVDIKDIRTHHLNKGNKLSDFIDEQKRLLKQFEDKAKNKRVIIKELEKLNGSD